MVTKTKAKKIRRRMKHLMGEYYPMFGFDWDKYRNDAVIAMAIGIGWRDCLKAPFQSKHVLKKNHIMGHVQIIILGFELDMSEEEIKKQWFNIWHERKSGQVDMNKRPQKEGRDNKGVYVGGGGHNRTMIRYPKLNRSKKVWKTFYEMFPHAAERDNWDGEKSDRYPRKKKR